MIIATSIFNASNDYDKILKVMLVSASTSNPNNKIKVYNLDLDEDVITEIKKKLKNVSFVRVNVPVNDEAELVSQKMFLWEEVIKDPKNHGRKVAILDCDMIVRKNLSEVFNMPFDVAYTAKLNFTSRCPINSGAVYFRNSNQAKNFLLKWCKDTKDILRSGGISELNTYNFGGIDQFTLCQLLGQAPYLGRRNVRGIDTIGLPADIYNLHHDWRNYDGAYVIHFKSQWSDVLLSKKRFMGALKKVGWHKNPVRVQWEPSYNLWKEYEALYEKL